MIVYSAYMVSSAYMRAMDRVERELNRHAVKSARLLLWGNEAEARVAALEMERHHELWRVCLSRSAHWSGRGLQASA